MPKKSKKNLSKPSGRDYPVSDDDSVFNDNASVISQLSDISCPTKDEGFLGGTETLEDNEEIYEEKIKEAMDLATQKSANGRVQALDGLCKAFSKKYLPYFIEDRHLTITDIIERALKKGKGSEQVAAANLASSLCIQLGPSSASEDVYNSLRPTFLTTLNDNSNSSKARAAIATSMGICCFLAGGEIAEVVNVMTAMEKIFMSPKKGDLNADSYILHTAAVSSWSLLMTMLPSDRGYSMLDSHMNDLGLLLESPDVDMRISVGEAIVILFQCAEVHDEDATFESVESLCDSLRDLATDSAKHRSKKDRKEQRSSFRDILKTIEQGQEYYEKISVNTREVIHIDSWSVKKQYDSLCKVLLSGVNLHLTENELIRDIFGLGAPLPVISALSMNKPSKYEKHLVNSQAFKHRTKTRGKERDKRSAIV
ncbi:interferon-related developmental regulator 1 [Lepeophtheirus salmonis]|uniref:Interferon-related developmental regulator 1 n=1 Tax=Lepeophtheirus salmonis TaxID=72036 RepID=A0A0K2TSE8_LEPSM|nr:interferon-related developmental regulator 1-like [Lepeophtheirus salmonis]